MVSTSTSLLLAPAALLQDVIDATGAQFDFQYGLYTLDCAARFSWSVWAGGREWAMDGAEIIWRLDSGECVLAFESFDSLLSPIQVVLGAPFLRQFCTTFDLQNDRLGFSIPLVA